MASRFRILSLCSGVGTLDLGVRLALANARTVCYVENEAYACAVLAARMEEELLDAAPIFTDLRAFDGKAWRGALDCIVAGVPCQPHSTAGKQRGTKDKRWLWPDVERIVRETDVAWCFFENVPGILATGFETVYQDLQGLGFRVEGGIYTAQEVGASHKRARLFVLAHREGAGQLRAQQSKNGHEGREGRGSVDAESRGQDLCNSASERVRSAEQFKGGVLGEQRFVEAGDVGDADRQCVQRGRSAGQSRQARLAAGLEGVGDADGSGLEGWDESEFARVYQQFAWAPRPEDSDWERIVEGWPILAPAVEPGFHRVAHGDSSRMDRLRCVGNAVVPAVAARAFIDLLSRFQ